MERPPEITSAHLAGIIVVYPRQSSPEQVRDNVGSTDVQLRLAQEAIEWGCPESRIRVISNDLGSGATIPGTRIGYSEMLELMKSGEVTVILLHDMSRAARNMKEGPEFVSAVFE